MEDIIVVVMNENLFGMVECDICVLDRQFIYFRYFIMIMSIFLELSFFFCIFDIFFDVRGYYM